MANIKAQVDDAWNKRRAKEARQRKRAQTAYGLFFGLPLLVYFFYLLPILTVFLAVAIAAAVKELGDNPDLYQRLLHAYYNFRGQDALGLIVLFCPALNWLALLLPLLFGGESWKVLLPVFGALLVAGLAVKYVLPRPAKVGLSAPTYSATGKLVVETMCWRIEAWNSAGGFFIGKEIACLISGRRQVHGSGRAAQIHGSAVEVLLYRPMFITVHVPVSSRLVGAEPRRSGLILSFGRIWTAGERLVGRVFRSAESSRS